MIRPTVGRVVWYYASSHDSLHPIDGRPLAALVAYVHSDTCANLCVVGVDGRTESRMNVLLVQPESTPPGDDSFARWMPYQVGQAGKTAELQEALAKKT